MAYTKKTYKKKVYRKYKKFVRRFPRKSYGHRPELKKYDKAQQTNDMPTTAYFVDLINIQQGLDITERIGNKINIKYIHINGFIQHNNTATVGQVCKVMIVTNKQQVPDTTPTATQLFSDPTNSSTSPINKLTAGQFRILYSKTIIVDPSNETKILKINKKCNLLQQYNGVATTDIQRNGLYLVMCSSDNTNKPTLTFNSRVSYTDN